MVDKTQFTPEKRSDLHFFPQSTYAFLQQTAIGTWAQNTHPQCTMHHSTHHTANTIWQHTMYSTHKTQPTACSTQHAHSVQHTTHITQCTLPKRGLLWCGLVATVRATIDRPRCIQSFPTLPLSISLCLPLILACCRILRRNSTTASWTWTALIHQIGCFRSSETRAGAYSSLSFHPPTCARIG